MPLASGETFAGFRVLRMLGAGAMGEVYLVQHPRLPRREALKVLSSALTADRAFRERFNREADVISSLWHPHIVGVHDRGEFDGHLWISMDFVDGTDAAELSGRDHAMPVPQVLRIVAAVADALDYAHQHKLLHRDVKPANILIGRPDSDERIVLADFGIAKQLGESSGLTQTNMAIGTVAYAAPEQLSGAPVDGRADQYALAATAFHLLAGSEPYQNSNPAVVVGQHLTAPPPMIGERRPDLAILQPAFSTAMAKDPRMRYNACADFGRELERLFGTRPNQLAIGPPAAAGAKGSQVSARRIQMWLGVAAAAVITAALVVVVVASVQRGSNNKSTTTAFTSVEPSATSSTPLTPASSLTQKAVHTSCESLSTSSVDAIAAVNAYVDAFNQSAADADSKARPAIDALNSSADQVARKMSGSLPPELKDALNAWVDSARALAGAIERKAGSEEFNIAISRLNETKNTALNLCDAAY